MTAIPPTVEYGHAEIVPVYFDDLDAMGIVHHARYAFLFDRALEGYWGRRGYTVDPGALDGDAFQAVRELTLTYRRPINRPGAVAVHFWVEHLGRTSLRYGLRILSVDGATVYAEGSRAAVLLDPATMQPAPFSDAGREAVTPLLRPTAEAGISAGA
ncbi:thioesterase family protein [Plantactinospora sp. BB1]|uniref:acyl-CoA thioesterase n=1 Tax=Plantactinospora sp. BB1 TaxID=2071627 RepID=UPI000D155100|nr:thioesterase family protein [Plantactinospora sp. BB1]AVT37694.1 thioesterase [Plantactinospora sp. BB1]